ncbi:hypothetical protein [Candidatus Rickettsia colombianensi]|uniref:hypothetical protein n=1 Tax=Candidatus Rickettsia colombianensi TaxID=1090944 RepID=UPI001FED0735|nr:hypothetical protein [Candidatus Rickettsia colombianensi]
MILPSILDYRDLLSNTIYLGLLGIGSSLYLSTTVTVMMNAVPAERSGDAAALQETAYELGNVLGIAVIVSITSLIYSNNLVIPHGVSVSMAEIARDSIGEGIIIAQQLPPSFAHELGGEYCFYKCIEYSKYYSRNNHANIGGCDYVCSPFF